MKWRKSARAMSIPSFILAAFLQLVISAAVAFHPMEFIIAPTLSMLTFSVPASSYISKTSENCLTSCGFNLWSVMMMLFMGFLFLRKQPYSNSRNRKSQHRQGRCYDELHGMERHRRRNHQLQKGRQDEGWYGHGHRRLSPLHGCLDFLEASQAL